MKTELTALKEAMLEGRDLRGDPVLAQHADWAEQILRSRNFREANAETILREEVGRVFLQVLEHAGVYKRDEAGLAAFLRFISYVNHSHV